MSNKKSTKNENSKNLTILTKNANFDIIWKSNKNFNTTSNSAFNDSFEYFFDQSFEKNLDKKISNFENYFKDISTDSLINNSYNE